MAENRHYDVIIIGSGAGGGTLAHRLAPSGKRVLILERGDYLPRERDNWDSTAVFVRGQVPGAGVLVRQGRPRVPAGGQLLRRWQHQVLRCRAVPAAPGGLRRDLRHYGGVSPAWPIGYDDLEPYYTEAEHLYLVHGAHGEDPSEGPRQRAVRLSAGAHEPRIQQLSDDLEKQGLHPFHLPIGVNLTQDEHGGAAHGVRASAATGSTGSPAW